MGARWCVCGVPVGAQHDMAAALCEGDCVMLISVRLLLTRDFRLCVCCCVVWKLGLETVLHIAVRRRL